MEEPACVLRWLRHRPLLYACPSNAFSCAPRDWSLIQALSLSSYQGFLTATIDKTTKMLDVGTYFRSLRGKTGPLVFVGASKGIRHDGVRTTLGILTLVTLGCNDILRIFEKYGDSTTANCGILLCPTCGCENLLRF